MRRPGPSQGCHATEEEEDAFYCNFEYLLIFFCFRVPRSNTICSTQINQSFAIVVGQASVGMFKLFFLIKEDILCTFNMALVDIHITLISDLDFLEKHLL